MSWQKKKKLIPRYVWMWQVQSRATVDERAIMERIDDPQNESIRRRKQTTAVSLMLMILGLEVSCNHSGQLSEQTESKFGAAQLELSDSESLHS